MKGTKMKTKMNHVSQSFIVDAGGDAAKFNNSDGFTLLQAERAVQRAGKALTEARVALAKLPSSQALQNAITQTACAQAEVGTAANRVDALMAFHQVPARRGPDHTKGGAR
jgi:hypothetical protein